MNITFWKFAPHPVKTTFEQAAALAKRIESGEFVPINSSGERFYKLGGWCYDIGRKPYLVQYAYGYIERHWAKSVSELRKACGLGAKDKVVPDPFFEQESNRLVKVA